MKYCTICNLNFNLHGTWICSSLIYLFALSFFFFLKKKLACIHFGFNFTNVHFIFCHFHILLNIEIHYMTKRKVEVKLRVRKLTGWVDIKLGKPLASLMPTHQHKT